MDPYELFVSSIMTRTRIAQLEKAKAYIVMKVLKQFHVEDFGGLVPRLNFGQTR